MSTLVLSLVGWSCAASACVALALARWQLGCRMALVAEASHELRGPLSAVRLGLATLVRDAEPERSRRHAAALDLELQRAGVALEDLAAARSGRRTPDRAGPVDVADLLRVAAETWTPMAAAWGVAIDAEEPAAWWVVHGDRRRLAQAIGNLVANAVEHGGGPVKLRARCGQPGRLLVEVVDRGSGPPGPWPPERRAHAGSRGHGLAVAARIAASCGGALVSAACDDGHAIALELPLLSGAGSGA